MARATLDTQGGKGKIRVSQATIDKIKDMGMTAALKKSYGASPEMKEALTRMYGARRVSEATKAATPANMSVTRSTPAVKKGLSKSGSPAKPYTSGKKKDSNLGLKITGGAAAAAALIASRGKATGLAAKLSPTVAKALGARTGATTVSNVMAKRLAAEGVKVGPKGSFGQTTSAAAKAGKKVGTKSEYAMKATQEKARKEIQARMAAKPGVTVGPKGSFGKPTAAPKPALKKKAAVGAGMGATTLRGDTAKKKK